MNKLIRGEAGFTLLELLVAISLLAIGLLAAASMQGVAMNAGSIANRSTVMASLGQGVMEDVMSMPRDTSILLNGGSATEVLDPGTGSNSITIAGAGTFLASYTVTPNTPITNVSQVDITVTRTDQNAPPYTITCFKRVEP